MNLREPAFVKVARRGFNQMYNLDYEEAIETFRSLREEYPQHPAPPLYLAILTWLKELLDRQDLDLDRFIAPGYFTKATDREMSSARREVFFGHLSESQKLCRNILEGQPAHPDARYFLGTSLGVLGSFAFTIDRKKVQALRYGKKAYGYHRDLVKENPDFYDSYLSVGLYEYILGNLPWYIKWLAAIAGYSGSEKRGFEYLELAAARAHYVADDARVLLMVLNVREKRHDKALSIARTLHRKYPRSFLLHLNQAQLLERMGRAAEAFQEYRIIIERAEAASPNYSRIPLSIFRYRMGGKFLDLGYPDSGLEQLRKAASDRRVPAREKALSHLRAAQTLHSLGRSKEAIDHYKEVLRLPNVENSHSQARSYLKESQVKSTKPQSNLNLQKTPSWELGPWSLGAPRLVCHRVDDVVDPQLEGEGGVVAGVHFYFRPLPGVAQVHVVVDHHHEPPIFVLNSHVTGLVAALFPGSSTAHVLESGDLNQTVNVVVAVKNGVRQRKVDWLVFWKDLLDLSIEMVPLVGTVKIVDHQESSPQEVLPQVDHLLFGQRHVSHFHCIQKGIFEDLRANDGKRLVVGRDESKVT